MKKSNGAIAALLVLAVFCWGASNAGTKHIMGSAGSGAAQSWPPFWVGGTRLFCAGSLLLGILRWTPWLGRLTPLSREANHGLWWRGGLCLAVYIVVFNLALRYTDASHVALYLGASPVWALIWDERPALTLRSAQRYGAAALAVSGVVVLSWPKLHKGTANWLGEAFGMASSILWAVYGRQCRALTKYISGVEIGAHTMWRAGALVMPLALIEVAMRGLAMRPDFFLIQSYCILGGGVAAYGIWNTALKYWPTSEVYLFNNLIPLSTMSWAYVCLGEPITKTFWFAMFLIVAGVLLGQIAWGKLLSGLLAAPVE